LAVGAAVGLTVGWATGATTAAGLGDGLGATGLTKGLGDGLGLGKSEGEGSGLALTGLPPVTLPRPPSATVATGLALADASEARSAAVLMPPSTSIPKETTDARHARTCLPLMIRS
jgi:hypothetical protein